MITISRVFNEDTDKLDKFQMHCDQDDLLDLVELMEHYQKTFRCKISMIHFKDRLKRILNL